MPHEMRQHLIRRDKRAAFPTGEGEDAGIRTVLSKPSPVGKVAAEPTDEGLMAAGTA